MNLPTKVGIGSVVAVGLVVLYPFIHIYLVEVRPRSQFPEKVRACGNAEELRAWALACLQRWDTNYPYHPQHITNTHPTLLGLWIHGPITEMYQAEGPDMAHVTVRYGAGGCGHWGLEIGPTNRPVPPSSQGRRYTSWAPGLCFFDGQ
jgi:hypothetical protein